MGRDDQYDSFDEADWEDSDASLSTVPEDNERQSSNYESSADSASEERHNSNYESSGRMSDQVEEEEDDELLEDEESASGDYDAYEFFEHQELSDEEDDMEEDEINPDELSYEELIALGEFIGQEKRGLPLEAIKKSLKPCKFQSPTHLNKGLETSLCVVCQVEYEAGEALVSLPCDHMFHCECITKWLQINKVCPICSFEIAY